MLLWPRKARKQRQRFEWLILNFVLKMKNRLESFKVQSAKRRNPGSFSVDRMTGFGALDAIIDLNIGGIADNGINILADPFFGQIQTIGGDVMVGDHFIVVFMNSRSPIGP